MDMSFLRSMFGSNGNASRPQWTDLTVAAAASRKAEFRVIDVREPAEFTGDLGHIEGAELVPLATVTSAARSWNTETPILVVCRSGGRSSRAAEALAQMGFTHIHNMSGGMMAWNANRLPVVR